MSIFTRLALGAALLACAIVPAVAVPPTGSAAWTDNGWSNDGGWVNTDGMLYHGPGYNYGQIGAVGGGLRIRVDRCHYSWCEIEAPNLHGWMLLGNISFGQYPNHPFSRQPTFPIHYGAGVCFYSGVGYSGAQTCYKGGQWVEDLLLSGLDNSFSSVKMVGGGSVMACRDRFFRSYCVILNADKPNIEGLLNNSISSIRVY